MDISYFIFAVVVVLGKTNAQREPVCFAFKGDGFLRFNLLNFDNNNDAHFSFKFRTTEPGGLLMYSNGQYGDYEGLFVREGKLVYHMFNPPSPFDDISGTFGAHFEGDHIVTTGEWVEVHVYRNYNVTKARRTQTQTGLVYSIGGRTYTHVDLEDRSDIRLRPGVYIGGYSESLSTSFGNFSGEISDIREEKNEAMFVNFSLNPDGKVSTTCPIPFRPV